MNTKTKDFLESLVDVRSREELISRIETQHSKIRHLLETKGLKFNPNSIEREIISPGFSSTL